MKKYFEIIVQFKFVWGLFFTASILLYSVVSIAFGKNSMEFLLIWQFVAITMILTLIHCLIFGEFILKSLSQRNKLAVHFILCFITMLVSSNILGWIDITNFYSLAIFTLGYTLLYVSMSFSFFMYYKITGEKLNNRLAAYKQRKSVN